MEFSVSPLIELRNIRKEFPGVVALDDVSMTITQGSIHALVGENGAGKSTLMKILTGTYTSYDGSIIHNGKPITLTSTKDAFKIGISIVSQELNYFPNLTIAETLLLGREPLVFPIIIDSKERYRITREWLGFMNLDYSPDMKVGRLSVGQKQMIEILKSVSRNCSVIVMDEPTSALTNIETENLFQKIRELKQSGIAFVFISHRLNEIFEICDYYTVLRDGKYIASGSIKDVTYNDLIKMMVGREIKDFYTVIPNIQDGEKLEKILEVTELTRNGVFNDITFNVHKGEIVGFAGMMGSGRSEIARSVFGMDKYDSGTIKIQGKICKFNNIHHSIQNGVAMVPEDRALLGFVGVRSITENMILPNADLFSKRLWLNRKTIQKSVSGMIAKLAIKTPSPMSMVLNLSGGNQQKVVLGKWLIRNIKLLILDEPTRGIDVGTKQEIYKFISLLSAEGVSIILISSEMQEVLAMSHRILVIANGSIAGILSKENATQDIIMKMIVDARNKT
jgi:ABC-type sugar transport system ATPase subunit